EPAPAASWPGTPRELRYRSQNSDSGRGARRYPRDSLPCFLNGRQSRGDWDSRPAYDRAPREWLISMARRDAYMRTRRDATGNTWNRDLRDWEAANSHSVPQCGRRAFYDEWQYRLGSASTPDRRATHICHRGA